MSSAKCQPHCSILNILINEMHSIIYVENRLDMYLETTQNLMHA